MFYLIAPLLGTKFAIIKLLILLVMYFLIIYGILLGPKVGEKQIRKQKQSIILQLIGIVGIVFLYI